MATQPTNLPVPSESPRDLKFNAGKIDEFVTSLVNTYIDRFGNEHYTIEGINWLARQAISHFGYITIDSFEDGNTLTLPNHVLRLEATGEYYRWDGAFPKNVPENSTPETTGGVGIGAWIGVGDASLRSSLSSSNDGNGDSLVSVKQPKPNTIARTQHDFNADFINVKDYGAKGNWNATTQTGDDDTAAFQAAINDLGETSRNGGIRKIAVPAGTYVVGDLTIPSELSFGVEFIGDGIMATHIRTPNTNSNPLFNCEIEYVRFRDISFYGSLTDSDFSIPANYSQTCYFGKLGWLAADLDVSFVNCRFSMFVDAIEAHGRGVVTQNCIFAGVTNELHIVADPDIIWTSGSATNSQYTGARHYTRLGGRSDSTSRVIKITGTAVWKDYIHDVIIANNDFAVVDRLIDAADATIRRLIVANNNSLLSFRGGAFEVKALNIFNISDNSFNSSYDDTVNPINASDCISHLIKGANSLFSGVISGNTLKNIRTNFIESTSGSNLIITNNTLSSAWVLPENTNHYVYYSGGNCPGLIIEGNTFHAPSTSGNYHLFNSSQTDKTTRIGLNSAPWSWSTESLTYVPNVTSNTGTWSGSVGKYTIDNGYCFVNFMVIGTSVSDTTGNIGISLPIPAVSLGGASSYSGGGEVHQLNGFSNTGASILGVSVITGSNATVTRTTNLGPTILNWADRSNSTVSIMGTMKYKI